MTRHLIAALALTAGASAPAFAGLHSLAPSVLRLARFRTAPISCTLINLESAHGRFFDAIHGAARSNTVVPSNVNTLKVKPEWPCSPTRNKQ